MSKFEQTFLIGAATAAHQVEGNNIHSDYWAMEHMKYTNFNEPSLDAVDHYNRYEEDIRMMAEAGLNAYRFSIEWARIEPSQGQYNEAEIEHYRKVLECCKENGIEPIVTMHHFTSPKWVIEDGGWEEETTIDLKITVTGVDDIGRITEFKYNTNKGYTEFEDNMQVFVGDKDKQATIELVNTTWTDDLYQETIEAPEILKPKYITPYRMDARFTVKTLAISVLS